MLLRYLAGGAYLRRWKRHTVKLVNVTKSGVRAIWGRLRGSGVMWGLLGASEKSWDGLWNILRTGKTGQGHSVK